VSHPCLSAMLRILFLFRKISLSTKRHSKPYDRPAHRANISDKFASRGGAKFNARIFFRGFSQFNGDGSRGQQQQFVGKCFYCNQQRHYARCCPLKGTNFLLRLQDVCQILLHN
jgi:hypothetical protein